MMQAGDADFNTVNNTTYTQFDPLVGEICEYDNQLAPMVTAPADDPSQPLRLYNGVPVIARTDVFFNFNIANPRAATR